MINFITIQKLSETVGIDSSYIRILIKNKDLTAYKKDGYKRIFTNIDEFEKTIKPVHEIEKNINLDDFLI